jgi:hypothetical protein
VNDAPRHRRPSWAAAAVLALVLALLATPAAGQSLPTTDPAPSRSTGPRLELLGQSAWVSPTDEFRIRVRPEGLPPGTSLDTLVYPFPDGRIRFERSIEGIELGTPLRPGPVPVALPDVIPTVDGGVEIVIPVSRTFPAPEDGVALTRPGVYPVAVAAVTPEGDELTRLVTHLIRIPTADTEGPSLAVGLVIDVDGTVDPTPGGDAEALPEEDADRVVDVIGQLAAYPSVALSLTADPSVLAALQGESGTGASAIDSLRTHLAGRQVIGAPFVDVDTGAWVASGLDLELERQLATGAEALTATLGVIPDGRTGVADPTLTPAALTRLHDLGLDQLVVPTAQLADPPPGPYTFTQVFDLQTGDGDLIKGITADDALRSRLTATDDPVLNAHLALADLAVLYNDAPGVNRGVALEIGSDVDDATLGVLMAAFAAPTPLGSDGRPVVSTVTLDDLFRVTEAATVQNSGRSTNLVREYRSEPAGSLGAYPDQLRATTDQLAGFHSLTEPSPGVADALDRTVLLSGARGLDAAERSAALDDVSRQVTNASSEIVAPLQQFVTLTSRSGKIPLNLENRLSYPVLVHVVLESVKLEFPGGNVIPVELAAATTTRLDVEVTTRASGAFPLSVSVQSPDGVLSVASTRFTVRSTAISGAGLVLSVGAGVFLLIWWGRHFRKVRRARQLVATDHPAVAGARGGGGHAEQ